MNILPVMRRIVWKEFRSQWPLGLGLLGLSVGCQLLLRLMFREDRDFAILAESLATWIPGCYAIGSTAVLFAAEREERTFSFLQRLAAPFAPTVAAKLGFTAITAFAFQCMLIGTTLAMGGGTTSRAVLPQVPTMFLATAELMAWGVLASLLTERTLNAVALAVFAIIGEGALIYVLLDRTRAWKSDAVIHLREFLLVMLIVVDLVLARRWLQDGRWRWNWRERLRHRHRRRTQFPETPAGGTPGRREWRRLVWQEKRHAAGWTWGILTVGIVLILLAEVASRLSHSLFALWILPVMILGLAPFFFGLMSFRSEQQNQQFRFLANRGVSPGLIWASKQRVWLVRTVTVLFPLMAALSAVFLDLEGWTMGEIDDFPTVVQLALGALLGYILWALVNYSVGQWMSIFFSRSVPAFLVGAALLAIIGVWSVEMFWLEVPAWWSVGLIPLCLLGATFLQCRDWLLEASSRKRIVNFAATLAALPLLLVPLVATYRVLSVPGVNLQRFEPLLPKIEPQSPQLRDLIDELRVAGSQISPSPRISEEEPGLSAGWQFATGQQRAWVTENAGSIDTLIAFAERSTAISPQLPVSRGGFELENQFRLPDLLRLLMFDARRLEAEADFDAALERYIAALRLCRLSALTGADFQAWWMGSLYELMVLREVPLWADHPQQSSPSILAGVAKIEAELERYPTADVALWIEYLWNREQILKRDPDWYQVLLNLDKDDSVLRRVRRQVYAYLPWERLRGLRLQRVQFSTQMEGLYSVYQGLGNPGHDLGRWFLEYSKRDHESVEPWWRLETPWDDIFHGYNKHPARLLISRATNVRGHLLALVLIAWRREHGALPATLDEVNGYHWPTIPRDPWSGRNFEYLPQGFPLPLASWQPLPYGTGGRPARWEDAASPPQPLLWTVGEEDVRIVPVQHSFPLGKITYAATTARGAPRGRMGHPIPEGMGHPIPEGTRLPAVFLIPANEKREPGDD